MPLVHPGCSLCALRRPNARLLQRAVKYDASEASYNIARLPQASFGSRHADDAENTASRSMWSSPLTIRPAGGGRWARRGVIVGYSGCCLIGIVYFAALISRS